jgi:acyl-CoA thioesterase FadM
LRIGVRKLADPETVYLEYLTASPHRDYFRTELWRERFGGGTAIPFVVARVEVDYRRQIGLDDRVRVGLRVSDLRGARYCFEYRVEANGELAAEAVTVMAHVRHGDRRPSRLPDDLRAHLALLECSSEALSPG